MEISPAILWVLLGVVLIVAEILSMSFVLLFFGIAALMTALVSTVIGHYLTIELTLFALLSLSGLLLFRKKLLDNLQKEKDFKNDESKIITLSHTIPAGSSAPISYQGSLWTAQNISNRDLNAGEKVMIQRTEGVQLFVTQISPSNTVL